MPTPHTSVLPLPKSWDEFEDIVLAIYKRKWQDPDAQRYGRSGQAQNGVDIYGQPKNSDKYEAVQCKRYEDNRLTLRIIEAEAVKVESFVVEISKYIIATTASRDTKIQDDVLSLNEKRKSENKFLVHVVFWEDICEDLTNNYELLIKYCGEWRRIFQEHEEKSKIISFKAAKENYLKILKNHFDEVTFGGRIAVDEPEIAQPLKLTQVFVIPDIEEESPRSTQNNRQEKLRQVHQSEQPEPTRRKISAKELFKDGNTQRVLLLGEPGSGKTALINYFVLMLCGQESKASNEKEQLIFNKIPRPHCIGLSDEIDWLPIVIRAQDLARHPEMSILDFIRDFAETTLSCSSLSREFFEYWLKNGTSLILFDGLDEVPKDDQSRVANRIKAFLENYDKNLAIITARPAGNPGQYFRIEQFPRYRIQPFDNGQIKYFIHLWYDSHCSDKTEAERRKANLRKALFENERVKLLARTPLLLTIILLIHRDSVQLPKERCDLYKCAINTLLVSWDKEKKLSSHNVLEYLKLDDLRWLMTRLAYWIHTQGEIANQEGGTLITQDQLIEQLSEYIKDEKKVKSHQAEAEAERFLQEIVRDRAGLISKQGDGCYAFVHKTFQEYLAAEYLCNRARERCEFERLLSEVQSHLHNPHWREVILLLVAQLTGEKAAGMIRAILQCGSEHERWLHRDLLFAGRCLTENPKQLGQVAPQLVIEILTRLVELEAKGSFPVGWKIRQQIPDILLSLSATQFEAEALRIINSSSSTISPKQLVMYRLALGNHQEAINELLPLFKEKNTSDSAIEILEKVVKYSNISDFLIQRLFSGFKDELGIAKALRKLGYRGEWEEWLNHVLMNDDYEDYNNHLNFESATKQCIEEAEAMHSEIEPLLSELRNKSDSVIDPLIEWLDYGEYGVSEYVAKALGKASHDSRLIERKLLAKLHDESFWERGSVIEALGYLSDPSEDVVSTLVKRLHHHEDEFVRASAAKALGLLGISPDFVLDHLLNSFGYLNTFGDEYTDGWYFNSVVFEALVQLNKTFPLVTSAVAQWIEQHQDKEYVKDGIDALWNMVEGG